MKVFRVKYVPFFLIIFTGFVGTNIVWSESNLKKAQAVHEHGKNQKHNHFDQKASLSRINETKLIIKVKGMVCAFCAQGIEKNFNKLKEVKATKVNLETMEVTIDLNTGKVLSQEKIKKTVIDSGFSFAGLKK